MSQFPVKANVVSQLIEHLTKERALYERLAAQARLDAIDGEMKQEGKYDTRAIEASYLAGAQQRRLEEIIIEIQSLVTMAEQVSVPGLSVTVGALVSLEMLGGKLRWYYISPSSGGIDLVEGVAVKVISIQSPLARALVGLVVGDEISDAQAPDALKGSVVHTIL